MKKKAWITTFVKFSRNFADFLVTEISFKVYFKLNALKKEKVPVFPCRAYGCRALLWGRLSSARRRLFLHLFFPTRGLAQAAKSLCKTCCSPQHLFHSPWSIKKSSHSFPNSLRTETQKPIFLSSFPNLILSVRRILEMLLPRDSISST